MSQFLYSSIGSKNYLTTNKEMSSSHPIFWSQRNPLSDCRSSELISWSYPPKSNLCAKLLSQISSKFTNFNQNYRNSYRNPLLHNNSTIDELLSTQVLRRMAPILDNNLHIESNCALDMSCASSDCVCGSSSMAEKTAFAFDDEMSENISNSICDNISVDSDSSNERTNKIQINDSKVLDSMQNDRQKKKKRKRRRRKKKSSSKTSTSQPMDSSPKKCFSIAFSECSNDLISFIFDNESDYESNDEMSSSNEELSLCFEQINSDLELMCKNLFVDYFFANSSKTNYKNETNINTKNGTDEIDSCAQFPTDVPKVIERKLVEELEMNAIEESIKKANEKWTQNYSNVSCDEQKSKKVYFTEDKPSVRVLCVWDYASRRARCGQWEQMARDRERFADKCRRIETQIGHVFSAEHRERVYNSRYIFNNS